MRAFKLISAVAFAALLLTSCEGSDPVIAKIQPYEMVNKMSGKTQSQVDSIFANINYARYVTEIGRICYIEDSTNLALLAECLSGENTSGSDFINLGTVYQFHDFGNGCTGAGYMHFSDTPSLTMADYTVVSNWAKSKLSDGEMWAGKLDDTGDNSYRYVEGSKIADSDSIRNTYLGGYTEYMSKFSALADSLAEAYEAATFDGEDNSYAISYYPAGGTAYGMVLFMYTNGAEGRME